MANSFYNPNDPNRDAGGTEEKSSAAQTVYADPARPEIKIVVDDRDNGERKCAYCGNILTPDDAFCSHCGRQTYGDAAQQAREAQQRSMQNTAYQQPQYRSTPIGPDGRPLKSKVTSLILCALFGWCGAHRFYEGKIATALMWMFTFGFYGIGWLVDLIIIATRPGRYYDPKNPHIHTD